jgi:hypothetical protein
LVNSSEQTQIFWFKPKNPVLNFKNDSLLTTHKFTGVLHFQLFMIIGPSANSICDHFFTAGLPSALTNNNPVGRKDTDTNSGVGGPLTVTVALYSAQIQTEM